MASTLHRVTHKIVIPNIGTCVCNILKRDCKELMSEQTLRDSGAVCLAQHLCYNKPMPQFVDVDITSWNATAGLEDQH